MTDMNASYMVGILSSTTLRMDQDNANHPSDLNLDHRRTSSNNNNNNTSFQITSVTRRGGEDLADDSCDDLDESHTDDLSSDVMDSSRAEGYHSEDDLSSPCCPQVVFASGMVDRNMNLSIGVTPTFAALGPVAGGVTMMTSKSESPISAQVPVMNPLPNNWQRRFRVVKIMSSEPFARGRWVCMDFKDPPSDSGMDSPKLNGGGTSTPPTIQITNCDEPRDELTGLEGLAQVYEIPIGSNFVMNQQHMYGIILPHSDYVHQPMTLVQEMTDRNCNHLLHHQSVLVQPMYQSPPATTNVLLDNGGSAEAVLNQINANVAAVECATPPLSRQRSRNNSHSGMLPHSLMDTQNSEHHESFSGLDTKLSRASGRMATVVPFNGTCYPQPSFVAPNTTVIPPVTVVSSNAVVPQVKSSQSAPEKLPSSEVGPEVDPSAGSAAPTGASTVAIDNKIEQAMDLVKSHLMFAVREEVEVLKEKITELLERISQLEHENDILRANASAETLKQLNSHKSGNKPIPPP